MATRLYSWHGWTIDIHAPAGEVPYMVINYTAAEPHVGFRAEVPFTQYDAQYAMNGLRALLENMPEIDPDTWQPVPRSVSTPGHGTAHHRVESDEDAT